MSIGTPTSALSAAGARMMDPGSHSARSIGMVPEIAGLGDAGASHYLQHIGGPSFRNIAPRSRESRKAQTDKETLERQRLAARRGGFHKFDPKQTVVGHEGGTPGFQSEAERFDTDTCGEVRRERMARAVAKEADFVRRRLEAAEKEERRWKELDTAFTAEEEKWTRKRAAAETAKSNKSSVPYDPITLRYNEDADGLLLRHADDAIKYRAALRAKNLQGHMTADGFNPITGERLRQMVLPPAPRPFDLG